MPKTAAQNKAIKDERKAKIIKVALHLFAVNGYDSTTIDDITTNAGCAHSLFYHYFKSKEEVFKELVKNSKKPDIGLFDDSLPSKLLLQEVIQFFLDEINSDGDSLYLTYMFLNLHLQKTLPKPSDCKRKASTYTRICDIIENGQKDGIFIDGHPEELAFMLFSMFRGMAYARIFRPAAKKSMPSSALVMNIFLRKGSD